MHCSSRPLISILLLVLSSGILMGSVPVQKAFDKGRFYAAMASGSIEDLDRQLGLVNSSSINGQDAYEGALLMKKAGLTSALKEKMDYFQAGRTKLESAIKKEKENTEFRFLRLMIQENAPALLNYRGDLESDKVFIKKNYPLLSEPVQQAIRDYCRHSKILLSQDF